MIRGQIILFNIFMYPMLLTFVQITTLSINLTILFLSAKILLALSVFYSLYRCKFIICIRCNYKKILLLFSLGYLILVIYYFIILDPADQSLLDIASLYFLNIFIPSLAILISDYETEIHEKSLLLYTQITLLLIGLYYYVQITSNGFLGIISPSVDGYVSKITLSYFAAISLLCFLIIGADKTRSYLYRCYCWILLVPVSTLMLLVSSGRGAALAVFCVVIIIFRKNFFKLLVIFCILMFVYFLFIEINEISRSLSSLLTIDILNEPRYILYNEAIGTVADSLFLGGNIFVNESGRYPHSLLFEILLNFGLVGLLLLFLFVRSLVVASKNVEPIYNAILGCFALKFMISSSYLFDSTLLLSILIFSRVMGNRRRSA